MATARLFKGQHVSVSNGVLRDGTLSVDLDTNLIYIHDGVTPGGILLSGAPGPQGPQGIQGEIGPQGVAAPLQVLSVNFVSVPSTPSAQTVSLSTATSTNVYNMSSAGITLTLNMPAGPTDGQVCQATFLTNTVTLVKGTGAAVSPAFPSTSLAGGGFKYIYNSANNVWYGSV